MEQGVHRDGESLNKDANGDQRTLALSGFASTQPISLGDVG